MAIQPPNPVLFGPSADNVSVIACYLWPASTESRGSTQILTTPYVTLDGALHSRTMISVDGQHTIDLPLLSPVSDNVAAPLYPSVTSNFPYLFNGATFDRQHNNNSVVIYNLGNYGLTQTSPNQINYNHRGITVCINVTAVPIGGTLAPSVRGIDALGNPYTLLVGTTITAIGTYTLQIYPGLANVAGVAADAAMPRTWQLVLTATGGGATYSVAVDYTL